MDNVLIINLGNSDIEKEGNKIEFREFREKTKKIYEQLKAANKEEKQEIFKDLDFPIIKAIIDKVDNELENEKLDNIILAYTNQKYNNNKDTVYLYEILKQKKQLVNNLETNNQDIWEKRLKEANFKQFYNIDIDPSDIDKMYDFYAEEINKLNNKKVKKLFFSITGGASAMNFALLINAIEKFSGQLIPCYLSRGKKFAYKVNIAENLRKQILKRDIKILIRNKDYFAAIKILENLEDDIVDAMSKMGLKNIILALKYAEARIQFNFDKCKEYAGKCLDNIEKYREEFSEAIKDILIDKDDYISRLVELKNNAMYLYKKGSYTDFLGRVYRFQEAVYEHILRQYDLIIEKSNGVKINKEILERRYSDKKEILCNIKIAGKNLEYEEGNLTVDAMGKIISTLIDDDDVRNIVNEMEKIKDVKQLRNKSILAHGFEGISKEKIEEKFNCEEKNISELLEDIMLKICDLFKIDTMEDIFYCESSKYDGILIDMIEKL
ncbi:hypothetical protein [Clostridium botulinum]|uniref:hypothetical protein n=1 Tax=Clostridium botulinum TaxID=1491 RepID=UPI00330C9D09|nr:hypothetical protein [Clostridium botulinum]HDK7215894.1 hypothetical protein [Clostridium botulinum]